MNFLTDVKKSSQDFSFLWICNLTLFNCFLSNSMSRYDTCFRLLSSVMMASAASLPGAANLILAA